MLEKIFKLESNNTSLGKEVLAGITTFVTMAYIIFVNPQMMAVSGMDLGASFVGTCIAASLACIIMGIYSNWPVSLAPGMGLNAFFTYTVVGEMGAETSIFENVCLVNFLSTQFQQFLSSPFLKIY